MDEIVQSRIVRVWESQDEQVHFQTIGDRMMADEGLAGAMLGMYQRVLAEGGVGIDGSEEQIALRLTGVVMKRGDRILVMNRIYEGVFGSEWVSGKLAALRPYGEDFRKWVESGNDATWLLEEDKLQAAREWASDKRLSAEDQQFLWASSDEKMIKYLPAIQDSAQRANRNANRAEKGSQEVEVIHHEMVRLRMTLLQQIEEANKTTAQVNTIYDDLLASRKQSIIFSVIFAIIMQVLIGLIVPILLNTYTNRREQPSKTLNKTSLNSYFIHS